MAITEAIFSTLLACTTSKKNLQRLRQDQQFKQRMVVLDVKQIAFQLLALISFRRAAEIAQRCTTGDARLKHALHLEHVSAAAVHRVALFA
jgi:hypothetical protein